MSSASAGKFQDHYKVLGIDPKSDSATIQAAYSKLAPHHHPKTGIAPDQEKFDALNLAFEVLSDPGLRSTFDSLRGGQEEAPVNFSGLSFFAAVKKEALIRNALMCLLYDYRRLKPRTPGISLRQIEPAILANYEELQLAIWYLKTKGFIIMDDKSRLEITVPGMDDMLKNLPDPQSVICMFKDIMPDGDPEEETAEQPAQLSPAQPSPAQASPAQSTQPTQVSTQPLLKAESLPASLLSLNSATQEPIPAQLPKELPEQLPAPAQTPIQPSRPENTHPAEPLTLRLSTMLRRSSS